MQPPIFKDKDDRYYNIDKSRLASLISENPNVILDLGCATGKLGIELLRLKKASKMVGVEIYEPVANEAAKYYDAVYQGDIESLELDFKEYFDFVICGDILEHLREPWTVVRKIHRWLKKDGVLISSIPNIRYWRILRDLIIFGKWEYAEAGILDRTHLRFFTRKTFTVMLKKADFKIVHNEIWITGQKQKLFNMLTFNLFEEFMGSQITVAAAKMG